MARDPSQGSPALRASHGNRAGRAQPGTFEGLSGGGADGNERLTATTGAVLIVLLAVVGVTILRMGSLLWIHLFVGVMLVPPLLLKMASTGYRFMRYYTSNANYRRKGPPPLGLRLIAPVVVVTTVVVMGSGVVLLFAGPSARGELLPIHKIGFFVWIAFTAVHVLGHVSVLPKALRGDYAPDLGLAGYRAGRMGRVLSLGGVTVAGIVLAVLLIPEFAAWTHSH